MANDVIVIYTEFSSVADAGGSMTNKSRGKTTKFMDTYDVLSFIGRKYYDTSASVTFSGTHAETNEIANFFRQHIAEPFWYSFADLEPKRLCTVVGDVVLAHITGLKYSVSVNIQEQEVFGYVGSSNDVLYVAQSLNEVVNVILPTTNGM